MGDLMEELAKERKNIKTDSYDMSIGEIISLYQDGDLKLNPAYQRLYRWDKDHKVRFIESILIGIPIPEIFVAQKEDGKWDIVDGVQRISTLLQLVGELPGYEPLVLEGTKYLPSLQGLTWETMPGDAKRLLKRARIGVNIILTENSIESQYELFQRLNTGGISLESQEIRNCLIIMLDESYYNRINELKNYENFKKCLSITEDKYKVEYHMELIVRYLIAKRNKVDYDYYKKLTEQAKEEYLKSQQRYSTYADAHTDVVLSSYRTQLDNLENEMQLNFNVYTAMNTQMQSAGAKLQEATPAFTVIESASMPILPAGPKRVLIAIAMTILAFIVVSAKIVLKKAE